MLTEDLLCPRRLSKCSAWATIFHPHNQPVSEIGTTVFILQMRKQRLHHWPVVVQLINEPGFERRLLT